MRPALRYLLLAGLATVVAVVVGVLVVSSDDGGTPAAEPEPVEAVDIPLAEFDTTEVAVARAAFCGRVPPESLTDTLGGDVGDDTDDVVEWQDGDEAQLAPDVEDVAHEFGCRWSTGGRRATTAEAWVFTPPVTEKDARTLVDDAEGAEGCEQVADAPAYGDPWAATTCEGELTRGGSTTASFRGLFGDAWLTCSLTVPSKQAADDDEVADLVDRTGRWCVTVARSAAVEPTQ